MFKKSADLVHLHDRTGSHATKGHATGLVEQRLLDETDFHSDTANALRWARIKELKELRRGPNKGYWRLLSVVKVCDSATRNNILPVMKQFRKMIREINLELSELKSVTKRPVTKVGKVFASKEERVAFYKEKNRRIKKERRLTK